LVCAPWYLAINRRTVSLHDLLREFAAEDLDLDERDRAAARHAEHYVEVLRNIDGLYRGGQSLRQALALFDAERANVETGQAWAAANLALSPRAADLAFQYTDVGAYVLNLRLPRPQWVAWLETAVKACRKLGNRQGEASALGNLGLAWGSLGDIRKAIGLYEQHLALARQLGDRRGEGSALGNLGLALASLGDIHKAITLHEQHLAIARELGDRHSEGNALGNLGLACASLGEIRKAAEFYEQHLVIARELGDRRSEGNALGNLGLAYASWGDIRRATNFTNNTSPSRGSWATVVAKQAR
jgi:tetratricopeptide (TPR) repeat protein